MNAPIAPLVVQSGAHYGGHVYWVKPSNAADYSQFYERHYVKYDNGGSSIYNTIADAISQASPSVGDVIYVAEGYTETLSSAAALALSKAGVAVIGLGVGDARPKLTFATSTAATMTISADNVQFVNFVLVTNIDALVNALVVTGDNCYIDIEHQDTSASVEAATVVRLDTANNSFLKIKHLGFTGGNATVSLVRLDNCDNVRIDLDAFGVNSTAWVEMVDAASTNVHVEGRAYTSGITDFSQLVVDTVTGSTWTAELFDASAGSKVIGSDVSAFADADVSSITTNISTLQTNVDLLEGQTFAGRADSGMTPSTTSIPVADISGFGDDFFNDKYYLMVVKNANSVGNAPEGEYRKITDYVSSSGTFTTEAFSANVEQSDNLLVIHESLVSAYATSIAESTGEADIDESEADYTSYQALLTLTPAAGAPLRDVKVVIDLDKVTTGWADRGTTETIQFAIARKVDGTNWRRDTNNATTAVVANNADDLAVTLDIGAVGVTEEARIEVVLSAEVGADTELPYVVYYAASADPTITAVAAA